MEHLGAHALVADRLPPLLVVKRKTDLAGSAAPVVHRVPHDPAAEERAEERGLPPLRSVVQRAPAQVVVLVPCGGAAVEQRLHVGERR